MSIARIDATRVPPHWRPADLVCLRYEMQLGSGTLIEVRRPTPHRRAAASVEAGVLRIVVALAQAMVVTIGIGAAFGVAAAIAATIAGWFAFEIGHMQF